ncbi:MAG: hypothetical protein ABIJ39_12430 [Chloroflexota bacterium]
MDLKSIKDTKGFVNDFLLVYLSDGIGAKTKREIDILVMTLLMNYADLAVKSNQELSILLQAPESKIKSLRYEARLKYPPDDDYVKREFLYILLRSQFDFARGKIVFAIEDEFLRHAIQGQLKAKGMFADSSFNTEIVRIDRNSLESVIGELYGEETATTFRDGFSEMEDQAEGVDVGASFKEAVLKFVVDTGKSLALDLIKGRLTM